MLQTAFDMHRQLTLRQGQSIYMLEKKPRRNLQEARDLESSPFLFQGPILESAPDELGWPEQRPQRGIIMEKEVVWQVIGKHQRLNLLNPIEI